MRIDEPVPEESVIRFEGGLPGFGDLRRFLLLEPEELGPVVLLQSLDDEHVSIPLAPVRSVAPDYELRVSAGGLRALGAETVDEVVGFAVLVLPAAQGPAGCNLLAPIVLNPRTRLASQVLQSWSDYPAFHPLPEEQPC